MEHIGTQTINTERLILRKIELSDAQDFYELVSDETVQKYLSGITLNYTLNIAVDYIGNKMADNYSKSDCYDWGIEDKETHKLIGRILVYKLDHFRRMANLIWYLNSDYRNNGFMCEAGKAVVKFLQDLGFERIEAFADPENLASIKVMEKIGMSFEGTLRKYECRRDDSLYDVKMYSIIKK